MRIQALKRLALIALIGSAMLFSGSAFANEPCSGAEGSYHTNPDGSKGGFVAKTAYAAPTAYIEPNAMVCEAAKVAGHAEIYGNPVVSGKAKVYGKAVISGGRISKGIFE